MSPELLASESIGAGPRVVLVHGFTQTKASMAPLANELADAFEVIAVDLPYHGDSPHTAVSLDDAADQLAATTGKASYLGYSLGGRLCLTLALAHPELVERLVLVGATAGLRTEREREERRAADEQLARRLEQPGDPQQLIEAFLDDWLAGPLFAHLDEAQADRPSRRMNTPAGLAAALRRLGTGTQSPSYERLGGLAMRVLLMVGANDEKFTKIALEMLSLIGGANAAVAAIDGAGHAAPFERPDAVAAVVRSFLMA